MDKIPDYTVDLTIDDVRLLYQCVLKRIETWEGSPRRPPEEQEHLWVVRDTLFAMILDYNFDL